MIAKFFVFLVQDSQDIQNLQKNKLNLQRHKHETLAYRNQRISRNKEVILYRRCRLMILIIATPIVVFIAVGPKDIFSNRAAEKIPQAICNSNGSSESIDESKCDTVETTTLPQPSVGSFSSKNTHFSPTTVRDDDASSVRQDRRTQSLRAWNVDLPDSSGLQFGYTMTELCAIGVADQAFRCSEANVDSAVDSSGARSALVANSGHSISGHVLNGEGIGLAGVSVVASPKRMLAGSSSDAGTPRFWTATDALGAYTLEGLPGGEYLLRNAAHAEYPSTHITARTGVDYADLVVLKNMVTVAAGQVLSSEGWPLEGASVLPILTGQPSVLTGSDGRFQLPVKLKSSLAKFSLRFQMPGYHEQIVAVDLRHHDASNNVSIDVLMWPVAAWTSVTGNVSNELGEPLAGRTVQFRPMSTRQAYQTTTNSDGHYTFDAVEAPADYRVHVFGAPGHVEHQQTVHVATDNGELNIVAQRLEYGTLSGVLVNPAGMPVPDFELVLRSSGSYVADTLVRTDKFGNFEILAVPAGDIVVASQSNPSILVQGLHLSAGEKRHLPLVLDWGEHRIRGVVLDANGNAVPASRVVLRWSHEGEGIITEAIRRTASDIQGQFAFSNLGPGPHSLHVSAPGFSGVDINHDLTQQGYDLTVKLN